MKVIGAGLPRTGTLSQKVALEMLGFDPCYHMVTLWEDLEGETRRWRQVLEGDLSAGEILDGFEATVDWPGSYHYRHLMEVYPDAKVLLSVRDGDAWVESMRQTIWGLIYGDGLPRHMCDAWRSVDPLWDSYMDLMTEMWRRRGLIKDAGTTGAEMAAAMERYNEEVISTVPADRLLVWSPKDGWEPLCAFLEVPVPDAEFPRVNDTQQFSERIIDGALDAVHQYRAERESVGAAR